MLDAERPATATAAAPVLGITGDIDLRGAEAFRLNVTKAQAASDDLVIDLRYARFVGDAGIDVLREAADRAAATGGHLTVLTLPPMRVALAASGLETLGL